MLLGVPLFGMVDTHIGPRVSRQYPADEPASVLIYEA